MCPVVFRAVLKHSVQYSTLCTLPPFTCLKTIIHWGKHQDLHVYSLSPQDKSGMENYCTDGFQTLARSKNRMNNSNIKIHTTHTKKNSTKTFLSLDLTKCNTVRWSWTKYTPPGKTNSNQCEECPKSDFIYKLSLFCSNCCWSKDIHRKEKRPTVHQAFTFRSYIGAIWKGI